MRRLSCTSVNPFIFLLLLAVVNTTAERFYIGLQDSLQLYYRDIGAFLSQVQTLNLTTRVSSRRHSQSVHRYESSFYIASVPPPTKLSFWNGCYKDRCLSVGSKKREPVVQRQFPSVARTALSLLKRTHKLVRFFFLCAATKQK